MPEVTGPPAVPPHPDRSVGLDDGTEFFGILAGYSLTDPPCGAGLGRRVRLWHVVLPCRLSTLRDNACPQVKIAEQSRYLRVQQDGDGGIRQQI